jgi:hypothetical protein
MAEQEDQNGDRSPAAVTGASGANAEAPADPYNGLRPGPRASLAGNSPLGEAPQQKTAARDPNAQGPTGYISFDRQYGSNAEAAQRGAGELAGKVSKEAADVQTAMNDAYAGFTQQVDAASTPHEVYDPSGSHYTAPASGDIPTEFTPGAAIEEQASKAAADARALGGSTGDVQALMGPHASRLGAALARRAGGKHLKDVSAQYAGLRSELGAKQQQGQQYAHTAAEVMATARKVADAARAKADEDARAAAAEEQRLYSAPGAREQRAENTERRREHLH